MRKGLGIRGLLVATGLGVCLPLAGCLPPPIQFTISGDLQSPAVDVRLPGNLVAEYHICARGVAVYEGDEGAAESERGEGEAAHIVWKAAGFLACSNHFQYRYGVLPEGAKEDVRPHVLRSDQPYTFEIEASRPVSCVFKFSNGRWAAVATGLLEACAPER